MTTDDAPAAALPPSPLDPTEHRNTPRSEAFRAHIAKDWAPRPSTLPAPLPASAHTAARRARLGAQFPGERLVFPAGTLSPRSNDTDFRFRPHSAFAHLSGLGTDQEPDAVLVLEPLPESATAAGGQTHEAVLYFRPRAERDTEEFYADPRYGELWVGVRPSLAEISALTGLPARHLDELRDAITKDVGVGGIVVRIVRDGEVELTAFLDAARLAGANAQAEQAQQTAQAEQAEQEAQSEQHVETGEELLRRLDVELARAASELRLVKDDFEIEQLREAVAVSIRGFEDIVRSLPRAVGHTRGERVIEGVFAQRAREEGNGTGYETIAAAGPHACTLHWIRNDGVVRDGELVLVDAGVEIDTLYTADVTRTLPINGRFTEAQRRVYEVVLEAADAAFAVAKPGTRFGELNEAAMRVIAARLHEWGLLPEGVDVAATLDQQGQFHRRWIVHGVSHHLGLDVHDCAKARKEMYLDGILEPGMVFTIEPGLYFMPDDLMAPPELRGIGVRIEDDVLCTADGCENLTAALPRTADAVEAWMAGLLPPA